MPKLAFFIGKGGVGKTTVSSSFAVSYAAQHPRRKVLLLSTDPAHSLADIFQANLTDKPARVRTRGSLFLWQLNAEKQFQAFIRPYRKALLDLIESGTIFSREEIEPLLETTLPGMAEVSALIAINDLLTSGDYDAIVVDTAPIGHTLRMFEMPRHFARFLEFLDLAGSRDRWLSQRFGEKTSGPIEQTVVEQWRTMVENIRAALTSKNAELFLVTSPEDFSLNEALRSSQTLAGSVPEWSVSSVVLNRAITAKTACPRCAHRAKTTLAAQRFLKKNFAGAAVAMAEDAGSPVLGAAALKSFGDHVFRGKALRVNASPKTHFPALESKAWPHLGTPLVFTMGKGGVGKTTVSASMAYHKRTTSPNMRVTVCSTDPAPSLDDIFQVDITGNPRFVLGDKKFTALEIDSVAEYRRWADAMQQKIDSALTARTSGGIHVDMSFDRQIFSSLLDIVPPGVDEIFAIFKILDLLDTNRDDATVIIDMAPTGHALELLRMPERMLMWSRLLLKSLAPHRTLPIAQDVAVQIASLGQRVRELAGRLLDPAQAAVFAVMLPEPLPDRETARLLKSLAGLGIGVAALFVNRVLVDEVRCKRCSNARGWQAQTLASLKKQYGKQSIFLLPEFRQEVKGKGALQEFTTSLWQLA